MKEQRRNEDLKAGDVIEWMVPGKRKRIEKITPYTGPLTDIIFAIAEVDIGGPFSLEIGGYQTVITPDASTS